MKKDNYVDADKVCKYYNDTYKINMQYLNQVKDNNIQKGNFGYIIPCGGKESHHYGAVFVDADDGKKKYCIIADTMNRGQDVACNIAKKENRVVIRLGEGLQNDSKNCKIFALDMVKTLLKNDGEVAKELIKFYEEKKDLNHKNVSHDNAAAYRKFKQVPKDGKTYETISQILDAYKKDKANYFSLAMSLIREYNDIDFSCILSEGLTDEDLEKGETLLYNVPNEEFLKWEYAGEFLKLAQSLNLQSKAGDKKAGKKKVELKNYSKFYSSLGDKVDDIDVQDKEKLKDKIVSTKIYCKKEKYKNLTNNSGNLDEETYRKSIKPMINFDAAGCEQLKGKFNKINK